MEFAYVGQEPFDSAQWGSHPLSSHKTSEGTLGDRRAGRPADLAVCPTLDASPKRVSLNLWKRSSHGLSTSGHQVRRDSKTAASIA